MVTVGNYEIVFCQNLMIPKGDSVLIAQDDGKGNDFKIRLKFEEDEKPDGEDKRKPTFSAEPDDECGNLIFRNWNRPLGSSFQEPIPIGIMDTGRELSILASVALSNDIYRAEIQFMLALEEAQDD